MERAQIGVGSISVRPTTIWLSFARLMTIWIFDSTGMLAGMRAREVELELQLLESTLEPKTK